MAPEADLVCGERTCNVLGALFLEHVAVEVQDLERRIVGQCARYVRGSLQQAAHARQEETYGAW